MSTQRR